MESSTDEESSDDESEDKKVEKKKDGIYRLDKTKMRPMLPPDSVQSAEDRALQKAKKRAFGRFVFFYVIVKVNLEKWNERINNEYLKCGGTRTGTRGR